MSWPANIPPDACPIQSDVGAAANQACNAETTNNPTSKTTIINMPLTTTDIEFVCRKKTSQLFSGGAGYRSNNTRVDSITISNRLIRIESQRAATQQDPLGTHNSTLHKQMTKAICLYYVLEKEPRQIKQISISAVQAGTPVTLQSFAQHQLKQVVSRTAKLGALIDVDPAKAELLLEETPSGHALLNAVTHLIKSLDANSEFDRFERLWRAFNALYSAYAKLGSDHHCQVALREHIEQNPGLFALSIAKVSTLTTADIRSKIRWNQMLLNNYPTVKKAGALRDSILRTKDQRILEIYRDSLPIRRDNLAAAGAITAVQSHLSSALAAPVRQDSDVVATLCIKYMYFVRNKIAHAERTDHGFSFLPGGADEDEIRWLSPYLEALVIDLINISDTF